MIFLIEIPDANIFYKDEAIKTFPDIIARSDIINSLSYMVEWWYINSPQTIYSQAGQNITFTNPLYDIDYHWLITENETVYNTTEMLGYNFHLKIITSDINEYYKAEHENLVYSGYENFNNNQGVVHKNNFKTDGISGYSGYSGIYLPVLNIIDSENSRLQVGYDNAINDDNLNPIYDDERDSFSLFEKYGLDPTVYDDQETFNKIQKFEQENFTSYNKKSSMLRILKPIDEGLYKLYEKISELEGNLIVDSFIAGENIIKHQLITIENISENPEINISKIFRANAFTTTIGVNIIQPRRCYGIALEDCNEGENCIFQLYGKIKDFNFWWDELYNFNETIDHIYFLSLQGRMKYFFHDPDYFYSTILDDINFDNEIGKSYSEPILYQEIGFPVNENEFFLNLKQPILRVGIDDWWDIPHVYTGGPR